MKNSKPTTASNSENEVIDFISKLPDPILQLILSGLPTTEEAVRTSILSTRWRHLWTSIPSLDIDCTRKLFERIEFKEFVNRVLVDQTLDLDSFRLRCDNHFDRSTVGRWIHAAVMRKVRSLDLCFFFSMGEEEKEVIELPHSLVTCDSLEVLRLSLCACPLSLPTATGFPALKVIELVNIELWDNYSVQQFLKSCPLLEDLSLINCLFPLLGNICVSSLNLKTLRIEYTGLCDGLQICCPKLVFLVYAGHAANTFLFEDIGSLKKAVIYPYVLAQSGLIFGSFGDTMCQLFAGVSHAESLSLNLSFIQAISVARDPNGDFPASLPNLKTLEISTTTDNYTMSGVVRILKCSPNLESLCLIIQEADTAVHSLNQDFPAYLSNLKTLEISTANDVYTMSVVIQILRCFPSLESFNLIIHQDEKILGPEVWKLDHVVLTRHLKRVKFLEFNGEKQKLDMARFLLEHGNELEEMVFIWFDKVSYQEKSTATMEEMLKFDKASSTVKLITLLKDYVF